LWYKPELVKSEREIVNEELKALLTKSLRENKKNKKKAKQSSDGAADE